MSDWFFYQERGKTLGPLTAEDLRARIRDGRLRVFDLIYKEGEDGWRMALEQAELREEFSASTLESLKDRPWVCLHRKSEDGFDFITIGPFSTDDVKLGLQTGKISYNDYCWKTGFLEWKRIGGVDEFNGREEASSKTAKGSASIPESASELLKNVVEFKRGRASEEATVIAQKAALKPSEAQGEDLTKIAIDPDATRVVSIASANSQGPAVPRKTKVELPPIPPPEIRLKPPPPPKKRIPRAEAEVLQPKNSAKKSSRAKRSANRPWADWGIVLFLALVLGVSVWFVMKRVRSTGTLESLPVTQSLETQPAREDVPPPPPAPPAEVAKDDRPHFGPATSEPLESAPPPDGAVKEPKQLILSVHVSDDGSSRIEVRSDADADHPVSFQIVGLPGQVAEGASYYRYAKLRTNGKLGQPLEIPSYKLPQGHFILHADVGSLHKEAFLNVGVNEASYKTAVTRGRKQFAAVIWAERLALYRLSLKLENAVAQVLSGQKLAGLGLESLNAVKKSNGANYVFFEDWWELKLILEEARSHPSPNLLERARKVRERMATFSVWHSR